MLLKTEWGRLLRPPRVAAVLAVPVILGACSRSDAGRGDTSASQASASPKSAAACAGDNAGLKLPTGFCATIFADTIGHARHLVVAPNGVVYVNTWSGSYYQTPAHQGGFLVALRDTNNDGRAEVIVRFGRNAPADTTKAKVSGGPSTKGPVS